jgi:hypothetical protein
MHTHNNSYVGHVLLIVPKTWNHLSSHSREMKPKSV